MIVTLTLHDRTPVGTLADTARMRETYPGRGPYVGPALGQADEGADWQKWLIVGGAVLLVLIVLRLLFRRRKAGGPRAQLLIL